MYRLYFVITSRKLSTHGLQMIITVFMLWPLVPAKHGQPSILQWNYSKNIPLEEGTSLHYYPSIEASYPCEEMLDAAVSALQIHRYPIVSTDAVYRQTFCKEQLWRGKGAVGVDMETSAVFSVAQYLGIKAVALLMVSDIHPMKPGEPKWEWHMTRNMKEHLAEQAIVLAKKLMEES